MRLNTCFTYSSEQWFSEDCGDEYRVVNKSRDTVTITRNSTVPVEVYEAQNCIVYNCSRDMFSSSDKEFNNLLVKPIKEILP